MYNEHQLTYFWIEHPLCTQAFKEIIIDEVHSFSWIWTNAMLSILARMIHKLVLLEIKLQLKSSHTYVTIYHDMLLLT